MSILINVMDMPKNCVDCKLRDFSILGTYCIITHKPVFADKYENERHENCPLVETPTPHGRLIDADALTKALEKRWNVDYDQDFANKSVWRELENAPTIIEAEGET